MRQGKLRLSIFIGDVICAKLQRNGPYTVLEIQFASKSKTFRCRSKHGPGLNELRTFIMRMKSQINKTDCLKAIREDVEVSRGPGASSADALAERGAACMSMFVGEKCVDTMDVGPRRVGLLGNAEVLRNSRPAIVTAESSVRVKVAGYVNCATTSKFQDLLGDDAEQGESQLRLRTSGGRHVATAFLRYWSSGAGEAHPAAGADAGQTPPPASKGSNASSPAHSPSRHVQAGPCSTPPPSSGDRARSVDSKKSTRSVSSDMYKRNVLRSYSPQPLPSSRETGLGHAGSAGQQPSQKKTVQSIPADVVLAALLATITCLVQDPVVFFLLILSMCAALWGRLTTLATLAYEAYTQPSSNAARRTGPPQQSSRGGENRVDGASIGTRLPQRAQGRHRLESSKRDASSKQAITSSSSAEFRQRPHGGTGRHRNLVSSPLYLIRLVEVKIHVASGRERRQKSGGVPRKLSRRVNSGDTSGVGSSGRAMSFKLESDVEESDGFFHPVENPLWCTALACGQMATHKLPRIARDLVLDYWHGPMAGFMSYDEVDITRGKTRSLLREFKENLKMILDGNKGPSRFWLKHVIDSPHDCCRYLMARDFNVMKAVKLVMEALEKREEFKLDGSVFSPMPRYPQLKESLPVYHQGYDDNGRLLFIRSLGLMDAKKTLELFPRDDLTKIEALYNEIAQRVFMPTVSRLRGQIEWRSHAIVDMEGVGISTLLDRKFRSIFTLSANVIQTCYPENMGVCTIIRAPMMFSMLWSVIKGVATKRTQNKISVDSGSDPSKVLTPRFQRSTCLPRQYGGQAVNDGPQFLNSEMEKFFHTYVTGTRDIREILPDNSEYSFIPIYKKSGGLGPRDGYTTGTSFASSLRSPPLSMASTSMNTTGLRNRHSQIGRITSEPVGMARR